MKLLSGLGILLLACMAVGVFRKLSGGTFLPPPGADGDHHVQDNKGQWWRYEKGTNTLEELYRRKKKR